MVLSEKTLKRIIEILVVQANYAVAAKVIGISERTLYNWRAASVAAKSQADSSSPFYLEHRGEWGFWHEHCGRSRTENLISFEGLVRSQAASGVTEPIFGPDQKPVWKERAEYIGRDDNYVRVMEGLSEFEPVEWHRLEHAENGSPVQLTKQRELAAPLRKAILAASHPDYRESVDLNVKHSGVVHVTPALERLASEPRPKMEELKILAGLSPEARRARLGASASPLGLTHNPPSHADNQPEPQTKPAPSYAKPIRHPGMKMA